MAENTEPIEFERGDKVSHPKWGLGTVLHKSGSGERGKVIVLFQDVGQKTLAVKFAKLEKISSASAKQKSKLAQVEEIIPSEPDEVVETVDDDGDAIELSEDEEEEEEL